MATTVYPLAAGGVPIVPAADLVSAASTVNKFGTGRVGDDGFGKKFGTIVIRDGGAGAYNYVFALGSAATDKWRVMDGSAEYTPS